MWVIVVRAFYISVDTSPILIYIIIWPECEEFLWNVEVTMSPEWKGLLAAFFFVVSFIQKPFQLNHDGLMIQF